MNADQFEERLIALEAEAQDAGVTNDEIIGAYELRTMALNESDED